MYSGTILDGELAMNKTTRIVNFLVFDAVCIAGESIRDAPFTARLKAAMSVITSAKQPPSDSVHILGKNFFPLNTFHQFIEYLETVKPHFDMDGIVFTPEDLPVMTHRHRQMFKWKTHHTIDFLVDGNEKEGFFLNVYDSLNKKMRKASRLIDRNGLEIRAGDVVECELPDGVMTWKPLMIRRDKSHPNDLETFKRTMINMKENILIEEFAAIVK
jgi:mRNA-capping enzyme